MILFVKRSNIVLVLLICIVSIMIYSLNEDSFSAKAVNTAPVLDKIVVIDAGHGGVDPGASGPNTGIKEKDINLIIAKMLKERIEKNGGIAVMTRDDDSLHYTTTTDSIRQKRREDLKYRKDIVLKSGASLFVSIHLNSFGQKQYSGAQVFFPRESQESIKLAGFVQDSLRENVNRDNKRTPLLREGLRIFDDPAVPTILVECGFLSNSNEERMLAKEDYQKKLADAIFKGIEQYYASK